MHVAVQTRKRRRLTEKVPTVSCNALSLSSDFVPAPVALHEELPDASSRTCSEALHILSTNLQGRLTPWKLRPWPLLLSAVLNHIK